MSPMIEFLLKTCRERVEHHARQRAGAADPVERTAHRVMELALDDLVHVHMAMEVEDRRREAEWQARRDREDQEKAKAGGGQ